VLDTFYFSFIGRVIGPIYRSLMTNFVFMKNFHEWLMTPSKVWFGKRPHEIFFEISNFYDVISAWRHYVTFITFFFDDLSLIFYFSLGFLNSIFKSFEKISHYGFYCVRSKSPKSLHFSNFHENSWFSPKIVTEIWSFLERYFLVSDMLDSPYISHKPVVIFDQSVFEFCFMAH